MRPSTVEGWPALGMALRGLAVYRTIFSMVSSITFGPAEQLQPATSTGHSSSLRVKVSVDGAVGQVAVVVDGDLGDDGHLVAGGFARGEDSLAQLVQDGEGLQDQQVDAGLDQRLDLLAEHGAGLFERGGTQRLDADAQRPDRAGDESSLSGGLARQPHAGLVDGLQLLGEAEGGQPRRGWRRRCWSR